jgi:hypothetical protein
MIAVILARGAAVLGGCRDAAALLIQCSCSSSSSKARGRPCQCRRPRSRPSEYEKEPISYHSAHIALAEQHPKFKKMKTRHAVHRDRKPPLPKKNLSVAFLLLRRTRRSRATRPSLCLQVERPLRTLASSRCSSSMQYLQQLQQSQLFLHPMQQQQQQQLMQQQLMQQQQPQPQPQQQQQQPQQWQQQQQQMQTQQAIPTGASLPAATLNYSLRNRTALPSPCAALIPFAAILFWRVFVLKKYI